MRSVPGQAAGITTAADGTADGGTTDGGSRAAGGTADGGTTDGGTGAAAVGLFAGFAGFGAGAVNLAIAASLLLPPAAGAGAVSADGIAVATGAVAGIWGLAVIAWTVLALRRGKLLRTGPAMTLLVVAAVVHAVVVGAGPSLSSGSLTVSHLAALLLTLMILAAAGWLRRQGDGGAAGAPRGSTGTALAPQSADTAGLRPGRLLLAAFGCAVLVAAVATPGLAASTAGQSAVPHGGHGTPAPAHHSGG